MIEAKEQDINKLIAKKEELQKIIVSTEEVIGVGIMSSACFSALMVGTANYIGILSFNNLPVVGAGIFATCSTVSLLIGLVNHIDNIEIDKKIKSINKKINKERILKR